MKTFFQTTVMQSVIKSGETHSLVMSHKRANEDVLLILWQAIGGVVERLIKAITAKRSFFNEPAKVLHRLLWANHSCKDRRVRGDHKVFNQPSFQAQSRNTEGTILIS